MTAAYARRGAAFFVAALGFSIPVSTAADNILLALLLVAWLLSAPGSLREARGSILATPPLAAAMLLFAALAAGCFHGEATGKEALSGLRKYLDLALIPVFMWAAAEPAARKHALACFGLAIIANLYVSYTAAFGLPGLRMEHYPIGFRISNTHSILVSLGAFVFLLAARDATDMRWRAGLIALAILCAHNVVYVVIGRTGYFVLAALFAYLVAVTLRGWRGPLLAVALCVAMLSAAYFTSTNFRERVGLIGSDIRIHYYRTTLQIIADHPLAGVGTGGFARAYAEKAQITGAPPTTHPHNDYLLMAAQLGIPGAALLVGLYATLWVSARRLASPLHRDLARGLVLTMAIGGLFNSVLHDHTEGMLFAWLTALLFAAYRGPPGPAASSSGEAAASGALRS